MMKHLYKVQFENVSENYEEHTVLNGTYVMDNIQIWNQKINDFMSQPRSKYIVVSKNTA